MKKKYPFILALLFSPTVFANCDSAQHYYKEASESRKNKHFEKALASIHQAIQHCPDISVYYEQGMILYKLKRLDDALVSFVAAHKLRGVNKKQNANALARIALVHFKKGQILNASSLIEQAYETSEQKSPRWLLNLRKDIDLKNAQHIMQADEIHMAVTTELANRGAGAVLRVNFNAITFKLDSVELTQDGEHQVDELGKFLIDHKKSLTLIGHTDKQGDADYNMQLSIRRANTVKQWLQKKHPKLSGLLKTDGKGESKLKYFGDDKTDHQLNRRVEMKL